MEWAPYSSAPDLSIHSGRGPATIEYTGGGWETIFAGLKELLESGHAAAAM